MLALSPWQLPGVRLHRVKRYFHTATYSGSLLCTRPPATTGTEGPAAREPGVAPPAPGATRPTPGPADSPQTEALPDPARKT